MGDMAFISVYGPPCSFFRLDDVNGRSVAGLRGPGRRYGATTTVSMAISEGKMSALKSLKEKLDRELQDSLKMDTPTDISMYSPDVLFVDPLNNFRGDVVLSSKVVVELPQEERSVIAGTMCTDWYSSS